MQNNTVVTGTVQDGQQHFSRRMTEHPSVFAEVFGCVPHPGTINVKVDSPIAIQSESSIPDPLNEQQVLLIEKCLINGFDGFRIRPSEILHPERGGRGDHIIEVSSCTKIPGIGLGVKVTLEFFREIP
jgi:CTP-dependent riboflavin kinase